MTKEIKPPYVKVLEVLKKNDPIFSESLARTIKEIDGALDKKTRELVKLGISSVLGQKEGIEIHSRNAKTFGASKEEIAEVVRIVFISSGVPGLYSAINAYDDKGTVI
jgi:AhpD family alkylhydroperoxidase